MQHSRDAPPSSNFFAELMSGSVATMFVKALSLTPREKQFIKVYLKWSGGRTSASGGMDYHCENLSAFILWDSNSNGYFACARCARDLVLAGMLPKP